MKGIVAWVYLLKIQTTDREKIQTGDNSWFPSQLELVSSPLKKSTYLKAHDKTEELKSKQTSYIYIPTIQSYEKIDPSFGMELCVVNPVHWSTTCNYH